MLTLQCVGQALQRERETRDWLRSLKVSCSRCPENDPVCLDFHHRDEKEVTVAATVKKGWSKERILVEIAKCDVLCSNCHRKLHASALANG
jgi:hypothetical protein